MFKRGKNEKKNNNIKFYVKFFFCVSTSLPKKKIIFVYSIIVKKKKNIFLYSILLKKKKKNFSSWLVCFFKKGSQKNIFYILAFYKNTCRSIKI
jgi:hypothetical protein